MSYHDDDYPGADHQENEWERMEREHHEELDRRERFEPPPRPGRYFDFTPPPAAARPPDEWPGGFRCVLIDVPTGPGDPRLN